MTPVAARLASISLLAAWLAPAAHATHFDWLGGRFSASGVPNPLTPPDTAEMHDPADGPLFDVDFTNKSVFSYRHNNLVFGGGVTVVNDGQWISLDDHGLLRNAGTIGVPQFINNGTFSKTGGGPTLIVNIQFTNNRGQIRADSGTIALNSPLKTFNDGTQFRGDGSGRIEVRNGGTFNGEFFASNFELMHGTYNGNDARLGIAGEVDWTSGVFTGTWRNMGTFIARDTGGVRQFGENVIFTNSATFRWQSGELTLGGNAQFVNNGQYLAEASAGTAFKWTSGSVRPTFANHGRFVKPLSLDPLNIGDVHFVNHGTIEVPGATYNVINFNGPATFEAGTVFAGTGVVRISHDATFRGAFTSNIRAGAFELRDGRFTGADARMNGTVRWPGGTFAQTWANDAIVTIDLEPGFNKRIEGVFSNNQEMAWLGDSDGIVLGTPDEATVLENGGVFRAFNGPSQTKALIHALGTDAKFVNSGMFHHIGSGTTAVRVPFENLAQVLVEGGMLEFTGALTQQGEMRGRGSAVLSVPGGTVNLGSILGFRRINVSRGAPLINRGRIVPGESPGTLLIEGDYTHADDGVLDIELQDVATFDRLEIDGAANLLGGELALHCLAGCGLNVGDRLDILDVTGDLIGAFDAVTLHGFGDGWEFDLSYDYDAGRVSVDVLRVPEPGALALVLLGLGCAVARRDVVLPGLRSRLNGVDKRRGSRQRAGGSGDGSRIQGADGDGRRRRMG